MIEKNINEALIKKEPSAVGLVRTIYDLDEKNSLGEVSLYHHFPFYRDESGDNYVRANVLFASKEHGIIIFSCVNGANRNACNHSEIKSNLEQIDNLIFSKIVKVESLRKGRRDTKVKITPAIYIHAYDGTENLGEWGDFKVITSENKLEELIESNSDYDQLSEREFNELKAVIEGSRGLSRPTERHLKDKEDTINSKGAILSKIEAEIENLDSEQKRAALFIIDGAQRIRGLAGSGKTIILAMKAALIHLQEPEANILFTYYTKALYDLVKKLITRFYRQYSEKDPNWDKIHIMHAWGGRGLEGVYYNACNYNSITPYNYSEARAKNALDPFRYICEQLNQYELNQQYDYALLDEAQDFPQSFYRVCRQITRRNRVIWAYDDFQNILDVNIQNEKETFGKDNLGNYFIDFTRKEDELQDLVLYKCYRNPRKILIAAFALGLGIYNSDRGVLQRLENNQHWQSLGFSVETGESNVGDKMVISRPVENTPIIKNTYLESKDVIKVKSFGNIEQECADVANLIETDLTQEVLPQDICVICLDSLNVKRYFNQLSEILTSKGIKTFNLLTAPNDNTIYKVAGHVTLSTIFKAKGNEAGSVYVMGIDAVFRNKNSIIERNKIFTAMTRSQAWVTLTGLAPYADICLEEINQITKHDFKLEFVQPSKETTKTILQDIGKQQEKLNQIEKIVDDLKKLGLTEEEIKDKLISQLFNNKK